MIQLAKQAQLAKFQPFLKTVVFAVPGATLIHIHLHELIIYMRYINF